MNAPDAGGGSGAASGRHPARGPAATTAALAATDATDVFAAHRRTLLGVAYRVLGSMTDAEDVVQDAWLRWAAADRSDVQDARAYLVRITTRLALNEVRRRQRAREEYVGPWLPEPVATDPPPDAAVEIAESVSIAMLVVLQALSPLERAAFVLREVFGESYEEIAATLERSPSAVRQLVSRARAHVARRSPRHPVDRQTHRQVAERILAALAGGSVEELLSVLSPDVVLTSDGGGVRRAALRPVRSAEKVLRFVAGIVAGAAQRSGGRLDLRLLTVNGEPAIASMGSDGIDTLGTFRLDGGLITDLYMIRNPDKLRRALPGGH